MKNFAITGIAGYIAPRHLQAIKDTGNHVVAVVDPHDSVGILDRFFPDVCYFSEFERFDRHLEKLKRLSDKERVHYLSICSPNFLHDAHIRLALRIGADAICEKPMVLNPWNLDSIQELETETGKKVNTVLQLRVHPALIELKNKIASSAKKEKHDVLLTYITSRGPWYNYSWKGTLEKSGGIATNIGVHFFDLLIWLFGDVQKNTVHLSKANKTAGYLELKNANVRWYLSIDRNELPEEAVSKGRSTFRSIKIDDNEVEFTEGFTDLHTKIYEEVLKGNGFGIDDVRPSINLVYELRNAKSEVNLDYAHPFLKGEIMSYFKHESAYVDDPCEIGEGTKIWHFSHVQSGAKIGKSCVIGQNVNIGNNVIIGNSVKIQNNVSVYEGVILEDYVFCGPSMVFTNVIDPRSKYPQVGSRFYKTTLVKEGASLGANSTIVCGNTIGRFAFVGAGSVVTKNIPDFALVVGNPARIAGWVSEGGKKLEFDGDGFAFCKMANKKYKFENGIVVEV